MAISPAQFEQIRTLVGAASGIELSPATALHVESCIEKLAVSLKLSTIEFYHSLEKGQIHDAGFLLSEAVADRETNFFRDAVPFDDLRRSIFPDLIKRRGTDRKLTVWSAGCATGQEPYSIAIQLLEYFPELANWSIEIHATDIAEDVLTAAKQGTYTQAEVNRGLPAPLLLKHFQKVEDRWHLKDEVRIMVRFSQLNLAETWPEFPPMDVILMRYLLTSWNKETQGEVLRRAAGLLRPDGYLLLGLRETAPILQDWFDEKTVGKTAAFVPKPPKKGSGV